MPSHASMVFQAVTTHQLEATNISLQRNIWLYMIPATIPTMVVMAAPTIVVTAAPTMVAMAAPTMLTTAHTEVMEMAALIPATVKVRVVVTLVILAP